MKLATTQLAAALAGALTVLLLFATACRGCPPAPPADAGPGDAAAGSSAIVVNRTLTPTTVYVSFGGNSKVGPTDWPFCGDAGGCSFPLAPSASQVLPSFGRALNVTLSFDQAPGCNTTLGELNFNIPGWTQDTTNISLVNGWSNDIEIDVSDAAALGPTRGADANADVYGVFPVACDICVARSAPPCGFDAAGCTVAGSCGCKSGTQYNPTVPCQESFAPGAFVAVALVRH